MSVRASALRQIVARAAQDPQAVAQAQLMLQRNMQWAKPQDSYQTQLDPHAEAHFRAWLAENNVPFDPNDAQSDYDMRGFWHGLQSGDPHAMTGVDPNDIDPHTGKPRMHFTDWWKTPYHETFSADSQYAAPGAPRWSADWTQLINPRTGAVLFDDVRPAADLPAATQG